jgi:hypothetical protein
MARTNRKSEEPPDMLNPIPSQLGKETEEPEPEKKPSPKREPSPEYWQGGTEMSRAKRPRRLNQHTKF